jgi:hypothetical protein
MEIHCAGCGAPVFFGDVDLATRTTKCRACNRVFSMDLFEGPEAAEISAAIQAPASPAAARRRERPPVPLPWSITVKRTGESSQPGTYRSDDASSKGTLEISHRWLSYQQLALAFFAVLWDGSMAMYFLAPATSWKWWAIVGPIVHVAAGIYVTRLALAGILNRTRIRADAETLSITHGPIPWPGNREIATSEIRQLYCEEQVERVKQQTVRTYDLGAVLESGFKTTLLTKLETPAQAEFLEQELERYLGIVDAPVSDEYDPEAAGT